MTVLRKTPDELAVIVATIVGLAGGPVDPNLIGPVALILRHEQLLNLDGVTFGCNYDLDVRSFELERGYVRAIDTGWLAFSNRNVTARDRAPRIPADTGAAVRTNELFSLDRAELHRRARPLLLAG